MIFVLINVLSHLDVITLNQIRTTVSGATEVNMVKNNEIN